MYDRVAADRLAFYLIRWRNRVAVKRLLSPKRLIGTAGREKHACRRDENDVSHGALLGKQMAGKPRRAGADGASPSGRSLSRIGRRLRRLRYRSAKELIPRFGLLSHFSCECRRRAA